MVNLLLLPPSEAIAAYHLGVVSSLAAPVEVRDAGPSRGKGIFATRALAPGDVIFNERALVAQQETASQEQVTGCAHCHQFVGSVEQRIAQLLRHVQRRAQEWDSRPQGGADDGGACSSAQEASSTQQGDKEEEVEDEDEEEWKHRAHLLEAFVTPVQLDDLERGDITLPHSDQFKRPDPVPCSYNCGQVYCGLECRDAAWQAHHCLLCPGSVLHHPASPPAGQGSSKGQAAGSSSNDVDVSHGSSSGGGVLQPPQVMHGLTVDRTAMQVFIEHSATTNSIFMLAAKLIASAAVKAASCCRQDAGAGAMGSGSQGTTWDTAQATLDVALEAAWLPYAVGWKRVWWEAVAVPEDVAAAGEEEEFRQQLKDLALDSLTLFQVAQPGLASAFPDLVLLDVWGSVVGMFELNNLGFVVPSIVDDYFVMADDLPADDKAISQPWLDALDKWYDTPLEGTGFFALHSCANHSCSPNAGIEGLADGRVSVYALKDITAGDEITISYLDEEPGEGDAGEKWTYQQRQAALRDYGFTCMCERCEKERARSIRKPGRKGVKMGRR